MDPLTTALLTAQAAAGVGKSLYGVNQMVKAKQAYNEIEEAPTGSISEYAQAVREAKNGEAATRRLEEINRTVGSATSAASTDPRLSGALGDIVRAGSEQKTKAIGAQEQNYLNALIRKGGAEERRNRMLYDREFREKGLAQRGFEAGTQNLISGIGDIGSSFAYGASLDKSSPSSPTGVNNELRAQNLTDQAQDDILKDIIGSPKSNTPKSPGGPVDNLAEEFEAQDLFPEGYFDLMSTPDGSPSGTPPSYELPFDPKSVSNDIMDQYRKSYKNKRGGFGIESHAESYKDHEAKVTMPNMFARMDYIEKRRREREEAEKAAQSMYNRGGAVETPGPFSHSRNPIYMMDKEGSLVGEMTGGEYIFNPEQAEDLYELAQTGNTQLHKFVRKMLNKSNFK